MYVKVGIFSIKYNTGTSREANIFVLIRNMVY